MCDPILVELLREEQTGGFSPGTIYIVSGPIKSSTATIYDEPIFYKAPDKAMLEFVEWGGLKDEKKRLTHERDQIQRKHPRDNRLTNINRRLKEIDKMLRSVNEI